LHLHRQKEKLNGEYNITGTITSSVLLLKVILTKEGSATPFIVDDTAAKIKQLSLLLPNYW
jgi:hypothetical protein